METTYTGFYARFDTPSKKDAAVLLGADNLVGDLFDVEFVTEEGTAVAWMVNRFAIGRSRRCSLSLLSPTARSRANIGAKLPSSASRRNTSRPSTRLQITMRSA